MSALSRQRPLTPPALFALAHSKPPPLPPPPPPHPHESKGLLKMSPRLRLESLTTVFKEGEAWQRVAALGIVQLPIEWIGPKESRTSYLSPKWVEVIVVVLFCMLELLLLLFLGRVSRRVGNISSITSLTWPAQLPQNVPKGDYSP